MRRPSLIGRRQPRALAWLAFAAMALLMLMPTSGRLLAAATDGIHGMAMAMADAMPTGMAMHGGHAHSAIPAAAGDRHGGPVTPDQGPAHAHDGTCPYCPLLVSLLAQPFYLPIIVSAPARHEQPLAYRVAYAAAARAGLGARGPPISL